MLSYTDALAKTGCENVETTRRKRRVLFAGFVARIPKRVMFGEVEGGNGDLGEQEQDIGWVVSNATCRCLACPSKYKQRTLVVNKSGSSRVEKAAER